MTGGSEEEEQEKEEVTFKKGGESQECLIKGGQYIKEFLVLQRNRMQRRSRV